jgi:large subunit ribosomal protein L28
VSICELTGKGPVVKNLVSHSNIKTKSRSLANVHKRRLFSPTLGGFVTLRVAASTLRSIEHSGGFDQFVLRAKESDLSKRAVAVKRRLQRKLRAKKPQGSAS